MINSLIVVPTQKWFLQKQEQEKQRKKRESISLFLSYNFFFSSFLENRENHPKTKTAFNLCFACEVGFVFCISISHPHHDEKPTEKLQPFSPPHIKIINLLLFFFGSLLFQPLAFLFRSDLKLFSETQKIQSRPSKLFHFLCEVFGSLSVIVPTSHARLLALLCFLSPLIRYS